MPRLLGPTEGNVEVGIGDSVVRRSGDGTFHVGANTAALMRKSGDFITVGTTFKTARGYECQDCGFIALLSDHCGRCDGTEMQAI